MVAENVIFMQGVDCGVVRVGFRASGNTVWECSVAKSCTYQDVSSQFVPIAF